jgi:hypothetical protein
MDWINTYKDADRRYSLVPFWFLNDDLKEAELKRQMDDFRAHGVYGITPHARMGLPREIGWMSDRWLTALKFICDYAAETGVQVILYDEGMYPSGSCCGQVVAKNPRHASRCLERRKRPAEIGEDEELVAEDDEYAYVNTRSGGHIRGVHFGQDDGEADQPPSADILNPEAVASFLHLTHDKHYEWLKDHFGKTITAIFTDEPDKLGRGHKKNVRPWTFGFAEFLNGYLPYDLLPHLAALWDKDYPDAVRYRRDFDHAVNARLEEAYYAPYHAWCREHGVALTGHPAGPMDMGTLQHFDWPGQDVVWRYLEPGKKKSIAGAQSTMGKCSSSAQVNHGRTRNLNECFGAYGWEFTYEEMWWVTNWLLVRGTNLLAPHAFYYSIRGPRRDERPPDVGPNNVWWGDYQPFADYCRRMCRLLAEGDQVCAVAVLGTPTYLPWRAAEALFEHQVDFNYLDTDTLGARATVSQTGVRVGDQHYGEVIIDGAETVRPDTLRLLQPALDAGRVVAYKDPVGGVPAVAGTAGQLVAVVDDVVALDVATEEACAGLRYRHVRFEGKSVYVFFNEGDEAADTGLTVRAEGKRQWVDPFEGAALEEVTDRVVLEKHGVKLLVVG